MSHPIPGPRDPISNPWAAPAAGDFVYPYAHPYAQNPYAQNPYAQHGGHLGGPDWYAPPARSTGKRVAMFVGFLAAYFGTVFGLGIVTAIISAWDIDPAAYSTDAAYTQAFEAAFEPWFPLYVGVGLVLTLALFVVLARKVAYRWFDAFLLLVPFYGYYFMGMILWRCTDVRRYRPAPAPWQPDGWAYDRVNAAN